MTNFFGAIDGVVANASIVIDRPAGSAHPRYPEVLYPVDYGYLDVTTAADGDGIDVFVGSAREAGVVGVAVTIDANKRDAEIKVLLDCSDGEIDSVFTLLADQLRLGVEILRR